jgi:hypothetical protein
MSIRWVVALGAVASGVGFIVACSGASSNTVTLSATQGATELASALCARYNDCAPTFVNIAYGSVDECKTRLSLSIAKGVGATGSNLTPTELETCSKDVPAISCEDILGRKLPATCKPPAGTLADGAACNADAQCANKRCKVATNATCGVCAAPAAAGGACTKNDDCDDGLGCTGAICVAFGGTGSTCDATHPCNSTLGCVGGKCGAPSKAGTACKDSTECDQLHGAFCDGKICQTVSLGPVAAECGLVGGQLALCTGPASCVGFGGKSLKGTCTQAPADGTACNVDGGAKCEDPAQCVNGTCTFPDPAACK